MDETGILDGRKSNRGLDAVFSDEDEDEDEDSSSETSNERGEIVINSDDNDDDTPASDDDDLDDDEDESSLSSASSIEPGLASSLVAMSLPVEIDRKLNLINDESTSPSKKSNKVVKKSSSRRVGVEQVDSDVRKCLESVLELVLTAELGDKKVGAATTDEPIVLTPPNTALKDIDPKKLALPSINLNMAFKFSQNAIGFLKVSLFYFNIDRNLKLIN